MKCPVCDEKLRISHTIGAGERGQTRAMFCPNCRRKFTEVSIIHENNGLGTGARALATAIRQGKVDVVKRSGTSHSQSLFQGYPPTV